MQLASFTPSIGQTFQFLTAAGGISGTFSTISGSPGAGKAWQITYATNSITLTVVSAGSGSAASIYANGYNTNGGSPTNSLVPEPSNVVLIATAIGSCGLVRANRRRQC